MDRLALIVAFALTLGIASGAAWLVRSGSFDRSVPTADTLRGARP